MSSSELSLNEKRALTSVANLIKDDKDKHKFILITRSELLYFNNKKYSKEKNGTWESNNESGMEFLANHGLIPISKFQGLCSRYITVM
jgi:hypothetical protein